jgi:D-aminopeptidase
MIKEGTQTALGKLAGAKPYKLAAPYKFELEYFISAQADTGEILLQVKRVGARTFVFTADDYLVGFLTLRALISFAPAR